MKFRNKWKMRLSVLLMVVMMLNMSFTAFAKWQKEDGGWRYYNSNGKMAVDEVKQIGEDGKWYAFDADGFMRTGWLDDLGENRFYAFKSDAGNLASNQWALIDDDWYYFNEISKNGDELKGGVTEPNSWKEVKGKYYYFDKDSKMASEQFIKEDELNDTFDGKLYYAYKDGDLAQGWLLLDDDGKECDHLKEDCGCSWYRFKGLEVNKDGKLTGGAFMGKEREVGNEGFFLFDAEGKMVVRDWCDEKNPHYYDSKGFRAKSKWLPINGYWYKFDANGRVTAYAEIPGEDGKLEDINVATPSNAPYRTVAEINPVKDTVEVLVGKEVDIEFKVELASDSDAASNKFVGENHDMRVKYSSGDSSKGQGSISKIKVTDETKGICKVTFTAGLVEESGRVIVYIDDATSKQVTVNTVLSVKNDEVKTEDVEEAIKNILNPKLPVEAVEGLKNIYKTTDENAKKEVQDQLLDRVDTLMTLEERYIEEKRITKEEPNVSDDVKDEVGKVEIVGDAFNADPGDKVQLNVAKPENNDWTLSGNYTKQVAFDIRLLVTNSDGKETAMSELMVPVVITMNIPAGFTVKNLALFNIHDDAPEPVPVKTKSAGNGRISFVTDRFSTYVFAEVPEETPTPSKPSSGGSSGGSGGGGGSSSSRSGGSSNSQSGTWKQDANGWWINLNDGTYPVNTWRLLDWNGVYAWYRFNEAGYMISGWFTDVDGHIYYMNPVSDGTMGAMLTGWQFIDGFWYYFNPVSDGTQGALLVNTTTPDGYVVNEMGQWIQ